MKRKLIFPKDFLWGASTAAHQVEGGNFNNDWWEFEQKDKIKDGSSSRITCDHYHLFEKDFALGESLGHNAHRLSLEWSRIQSQPDVWDPKEVEHYKQVLLSLRKHKLTSFITLHHFTNPLWFAKIGGWENPKSPEIFTKYVHFCVKNFGDLVDFWLTINEPQVIVGFGYLQGKYSPGKHNPLLAFKVAQNLMKGHRAAYKEIHRQQKNAKVSFAYPQNFVEIKNKFYLPALLAKSIYTFVHDYWFLQQARDYLDFIGLNYYHSVKIGFDLFHPTDAGPKGIFKVLVDLKKERLPIYITENGIVDATDFQRPRFLLEHLYWIWRAIKERIDVRSYLYWSFIDNFEWVEGTSIRMGLCQTNYKTLVRTPRRSARMFKEIIEANGITEKIVRKYQPQLLKEIFQ